MNQQDKGAIVLVGRLNPPTKAHLKIIDLMKKYQRESRDLMPFIVIVDGKESGKDKERNPLSADDRQAILRASGAANGVKTLVASSAMDAFEKVREAGYEPMVVAAGSDRLAGYLKLLDKYFTGPNGESIKHIALPGLDNRDDPDDDGQPSEEVLELAETGSDIPLTLVSGSMARLAVKLGKRKAFAKVLGLKQELADVVFNKLQRILGSSDNAK